LEAENGKKGTASLRRVVMASLVGTTIEWYDFFLYGSAAALVFNRLFFPTYDPLTGTLLAFAAITIALVLHGAMYGPQAAMIAELFPTRTRYSGASIAYQLTSIFAGSLAPIVALWLYHREHSALPVAIYVAVACAISGVSALLARETKGVELDAIK
jgi:MFS family permease